MANALLDYELQDRFVHNWLVAGPLTTPLDIDEEAGRDERAQKLMVAQARYTQSPEIEGEPVEWGIALIDGEELRWSYVRCLDDHFVDLSTFHHNWTYLRSWAYTRLSLFDPAEVTFVLTTNGPADVWVNGEHVHRQEHFHHQDPKSVEFTASLQADDNEILVRFEEVAARECPYVMALEVKDGVDVDDVEVRVPSATERIARHIMFERVLPQAFLERETAFKGRHVMLHWAEDLQARFNYQYSVQDARDRIHISGQLEATPGTEVDVGHDFRIWQGPFRVVLRPQPTEYYPPNEVRYQWELPFYILDTEYAETPYGTFEGRVQEALEYAATQEDNLYGVIAKFAIEEWDEVNEEVVLEAIESINERGDCSDFYLVGLLGIMYRYMDQEEFPESLKAPLKACVLNFKYWHDEPGTDAMCYTTENHSILFHTCEVLAGQLYPDEVFTNNGETGQWHREKGERLALDWLKTRAATGFWEWDSNCYFEEDLLALSHLVGLADSEDVSELAAVIIDKILFTMAVNSYKGTFGSTHGRTYAQQIKTGQLEATSGIGRLMWGMGVWNQHLRGLVGMATSEYPFPLMIADIATHFREEMWNRERHVIDEAGDEVNKVTYKTPDYMLASAQDFHPGEKGYQQHIWQATFGPDAVIFVNHPPCVSEAGAHRPNFWSGNYVLPRVAQWKDVLFAVHQLPEDDWLGFTHAYFPTYTFDEYAVRGKWAFARKGEGYLALYASAGLTLVKRGPAAYRELRSDGRQNVWICQMGRAVLDGDFEAFQENVLRSGLSVEGLDVRYISVRGEALEFGWEGPLLRDGEELPLSEFKHYENPYSVTELRAEQMDIGLGEYLMRLQF
ncbi:MAG: hypothetical protein ACP5JG_04510 [Anaerolineae bacterium]